MWTKVPARRPPFEGQLGQGFSPAWFDRLDVICGVVTGGDGGGRSQASGGGGGGQRRSGGRAKAQSGGGKKDSQCAIPAANNPGLDMIESMELDDSTFDSIFNEEEILFSPQDIP